MPIGKSICVAAILSLPPVTVGIKLINKEPYRTSAGATASNFPDGEDFYSNCWLLAGCKWENAVDNNNKSIDDARQCSCNRNPDKWDGLIWFYTKANFKGDIYKGFGHWGECQDLPKIWNGRAESIQITVPDILCCVYTQQGCNKDSGLFTQRDGTEPEEQSVAEFQGQFYKGVHSFKCSKKFNALTTCNYPGKLHYKYTGSTLRSLLLIFNGGRIEFLSNGILNVILVDTLQIWIFVYSCQPQILSIQLRD